MAIVVWRGCSGVAGRRFVNPRFSNNPIYCAKAGRLFGRSLRTVGGDADCAKVSSHGRRRR